ncbi:MAG TPA: HD domain-containing phosphohydrolase [Candidatus Omnitrophota bacterium]|nr:HD domain-containing phosphohydrolase [Candidatus Omnitrophota bacterium]
MRDPSQGPIRLLLVEDNPGDARLVQLLLAEVGGFRLDCVGTLKEAVSHLAAHPAEAVLLDLSLPDSHGLGTIDTMRAAAPELPLIVFTGLDDEAMGRAAVQRGCQDYLVKGQGDGHLIRRTVTYSIERKAVEDERRRAAEHLKRVLVQTVRAVSLTLEMRDPYTAGHQRRVAQLAVSIGQRLGLDPERLEGLHTGALIHDIGKINVPAEFLSRPGKLSTDALAIIRSHPGVGSEIVADIEFPWPVAQMIAQHHERLDGTGYPLGLKGDEIILEARIVAVADVVEAMASHRPYRPSLGVDAALQEIQDGAGTRFDPEVVRLCVEIFRDNGITALDTGEDLPLAM